MRMRRKELEEKVQLLKAGQVVEIDGNWFRAIKLSDNSTWQACEACDLDSLCRGEVARVCCEMDWPLANKWFLRLARRQ